MTDPALAPWSGGVARLGVGVAPGVVLRHLPGRRVACRAETPDGPAVLKVFANPRARKTHDRLTALADTPVAGDVPAPIAVDPDGHVSLVRWLDGVPVDGLPDRRLPDACLLVGRVLRRLHGCGADLGRRWGVEEEIANLRRMATPATAALVEDAALDCADLGTGATVVAHRDLHPSQVVVDDGAARLIDLDDAAMAPAGLDLGNMLAHLRRDAVLGERDHETTAEARDALLEGYGPHDEDVAAWERLSLLRLAGLAEARHGRADQAAALLADLSAHRRTRT